jgi:hypothetical protein
MTARRICMSVLRHAYATRLDVLKESLLDKYLQSFDYDYKCTTYPKVGCAEYLLVTVYKLQLHHVQVQRSQSFADNTCVHMYTGQAARSLEW